MDYGLQIAIILFAAIQEENERQICERRRPREYSVYGWMGEVGTLSTELRTYLWENAVAPTKCTRQDVYHAAIRDALNSLLIAEMYFIEDDTKQCKGGVL